eukprot:scaffold36809_cov56-Phaeocystis_antarctica.AAC.4
MSHSNAADWVPCALTPLRERSSAARPDCKSGTADRAHDSRQHSVPPRRIECSTALVVCLPILRVLLALLVLLALGARLLVLRLRLPLLQVGECRIHGVYRRGAGRDVVQIERLERRQRAAVERRGEGGAAGVGDLGGAEAEHLELRQHTSRRRRRT